MNAITLLRAGFLNCAFINNIPKAIKEVIMRVINDPNVILFPKELNNIEVEPINDMTNKVTLSFVGEEVTSIWTWRKSVDGVRFVISSIE